jgi:predicted AAA+ superfamily ATPase
MKKILQTLLAAFYERDLPELCNRNISFPEINGKVTSIIGMRRTGKTCLCYQRMRELLEQNVSKERLLYLNFEDDRLLGFKIEDCRDILDVYFSMFPENRSEVCYFFFDEIQDVTGWEIFIRRMLDTEKIQVTLTGSSSKLLSREIATSLRGRAIEQ